MSLTPQQLFDNYSNLCIAYAQNAGDSSFNTTKFSLYDNGTGIIQITSWNSPVPQPTNTQLQNMSLSSATNQQSITQINNIVPLPIFTSSQIQLIANPQDGLLIYNSSSKALQISIGGVFKTITTS